MSIDDPIVDAIPEVPTDRPLAASRARMRRLLSDPMVAELAREAMSEQPAGVDEIVERARSGEYAQEVLIEEYGLEFVETLKSRSRA